jgi:hypothetical protein
MRWTTPLAKVTAALAVVLMAASGSAGVGLSTPGERLAEGNGANDGEDYFAYGDSIVAARDVEGSGLAPNGFDSFVMWHRNLNDPAKSADHNSNGSGQGCLWAKAHLADFVNWTNRSQVYVLAFGNNDPRSVRGGLTPEQSASCLADLYNATVVKRPATVWANISPITVPCAVGADYDVGLEAQRARAQAIQAKADQLGVPLWNRYDAIDIEPGNGVLDPADPALLFDCIHPNRDGHIRLAQSLGAFLGAA